MKGYAECVPDRMTTKVSTVLSAQATSFMRHIIYDKTRLEEQEALLPAIWQTLKCQGSEAVVDALLHALHDVDWKVREQAAESLVKLGASSEAVVNALVQALHDARWEAWRLAAESLGQLGASSQAAVDALLHALHDADREVQSQAAKSLVQLGASSEAVVSALLQALHDADSGVRSQAAESLVKLGADSEVAVNALLQALHDASWQVRSQAARNMGRLEIKDPIQLRHVLVALNCCLYDWDDDVRGAALGSIRRLLDGRPIPGYQWVPLQKRRARYLRLKRIAFWLDVTTVVALIGLAATWLLGALNPNGFPMRFLAVLAGIIAFVAVVAQVLGRTLRDPWEHS
jgi:HEAT repeat protein